MFSEFIHDRLCLTDLTDLLPHFLLSESPYLPRQTHRELSILRKEAGGGQGAHHAPDAVEERPNVDLWTPPGRKWKMRVSEKENGLVSLGGKEDKEKGGSTIVTNRN